jgi:hypothetical protein
MSIIHTIKEIYSYILDEEIHSYTLDEEICKTTALMFYILVDRTPPTRGKLNYIHQMTSK